MTESELTTIIAKLETRIERLEAENQQLREQVADLQERADSIDRLRQRVDEVDARTDLLQLVNDADEMSAEQRSITILQHMHTKIQRTRIDRCAMTVDDVRECLRYPGLDRTTFYSDMRRCERLVDDQDVCWYAGDGVGDRDDACVVLALDNGDLPAEYRPGGGGGGQ